MADILGGIIFSEFLADNPFTGNPGGFDTDGDATATKSDDFIELQNTTGATVSLEGYELWSTQNGLLYAFGPTATIAASQTAVVIGEYTGTPPAGYFDAGLAEGANFLDDGDSGGDTIFLVDTATGDYITFSYGVPPPMPVTPFGFPGTTQLGSGENINSSAPNGAAFSRDASGNWVTSSPGPGNPGTVCFLTGTRIMTAKGERRVESLSAGDLVQTRDHGYQPILCVVSQKVSSNDLDADPRLRPIALATPNHPTQPLLFLSRQHGVLITLPGSSKTALARAGHLAALKGGGARIAHGKKSVVYHNFLLPQHGIVFANSLAVESFLPGDFGMGTLGPLSRKLVRDCLGRSNGSMLTEPIAPYVARKALPSRFDALALHTKNEELA